MSIHNCLITVCLLAAVLFASGTLMEEKSGLMMTPHEISQEASDPIFGMMPLQDMGSDERVADSCD